MRTADFFIMGILLWILADIAGVHHTGHDADVAHELYSSLGIAVMIGGVFHAMFSRDELREFVREFREKMRDK